MRSGSCYCGGDIMCCPVLTQGDVTYEFDDDSNNGGVVCYCKTCQNLHSSESYNLKTEVDKVHVKKGQPKSYKDNKTDSGKTITRYFCGDCGSALWSDPDAMPGVRFLKVGSLDDPQDVSLFAEIYVDSALKHAVRPKASQKQFEGMMAKEV